MTPLACIGCRYIAPPLDPRPFRCPNSGDGADHVLQRRPALTNDLRCLFFDDEPNPFIRYRRLLHWWETAIAIGMSDADTVDLVRRLDERVASLDGHGFAVTPLVEKDHVWIKDETSNIGGSHKGRHLFGLMLWLAVAERIDPSIADAPLAIASCGNAALAAAVIARAARRALDVFIPVDADPHVVSRLEDLGARLTRCRRDSGATGDPCYVSFRESVARGALPFTCQGNENGLVIEGGKTLGWEMVSQHLARNASIDHLFVQVGGGALASACVAAFEEAHLLGLIPTMPRIHAVQAAAVAPLARAWSRLGERTVDYAIAHRSQFMWPWETVPKSVATGIVDDETYDWVAVLRGMRISGGEPVIVDEGQLLEANRIAVESTGIPVGVTGSAGYAGMLNCEIEPGESSGVLFTGVRQSDLIAPTMQQSLCATDSPNSHSSHS